MKQTTQAKYNDMLEVLPPASMQSNNGAWGFLVGEPTDHDEHGVELYQAYYVFDETYFVGDIMTVDAFKAYIHGDTIAQDIQDAIGDYAEDASEYLTLSEDYDTDQLDAYIYLFGSNGDQYLENFEDSIAGEYDSDEEFAQDMVEQLGLINEDVSWPYTCIDWEHASRELMYDYAEHNGYYFRNI